MAYNVCYKIKNPVVYNKGTEWERTADTFLAYVSRKPLEVLTKEVEELNAKHPEKDNGWNTIDWNNVIEYFINGVNTWVDDGGLD